MMYTKKSRDDGVAKKLRVVSEMLKLANFTLFIFRHWE